MDTNWKCWLFSKSLYEWNYVIILDVHLFKDVAIIELYILKTGLWICWKWTYYCYVKIMQ